jgi:hypothetical protein
MNFSVSTLAAGFVFGVIGIYLIKRGKQLAHLPYLFAGLTLLIFPYFVENEWMLWGIGSGIVLMAYRLRY